MITPVGTDTYTLDHCEVCGADSQPPVLDLGSQAMCDDLVRVGDSRVCKRYPIEISICPDCLTAHQTHRIRKETLFPTDYHYRPRFTKDVLDGMQGLVADLEKAFGDVTHKKVVDVGCNDGSLLSFFKKRGAITAGIEPTDAAAEASQSGHQVRQAFFSPDSADTLVHDFGQADIVTFTNVFAHIESLDEAIEAVKRLTHDDSLVVIENHYLGTVLDTFQFDTFYHEHPRTYSKKSFEVIAERLGGELIDVSFPSRYGGNIRVVIGNFGSSSKFTPTAAVSQTRIDEASFPYQLEQMQTEMLAWKKASRISLDAMKASGEVMHGKSFPGRAAILAHLLDIDTDDQPVVYEKPGSLKIGHYLPGTRIEIRSDEEWINSSNHPDSMFIWGWHIGIEIASYMRSAGFMGKILLPLPSLQEHIQSAAA